MATHVQTSVDVHWQVAAYCFIDQRCYRGRDSTVEEHPRSGLRRRYVTV